MCVEMCEEYLKRKSVTASVVGLRIYCADHVLKTYRPAGKNSIAAGNF